MAPHKLTSAQLISLVSSVFPPLPQDRKLAVLVDLPSAREADNEDPWYGGSPNTKRAAAR